MIFKTIDDVFTWFQSFVNLEKKDKLYTSRNYRLDRMRFMLKEVGDPQNEFEIWHIAGSKGKGSTAHFLGALIAAGGYETGLFTSPHLHSYTERFQIIGREADEQTILKVGQYIHTIIERISLKEVSTWDYPTTFELLTLFGFLYFKEKGCTHLVLETGLGGRLDATNVVTPQASIITSIEKEHTEILGTELSQIAEEKGGIIKQNIPLFTAVYQDEIKQLYRDKCKALNSPCHIMDEQVQLKNLSVTSRGTSFTIDEKAFFLPVPGEIQGRNAALALWVLKNTLPTLSLDVCARGLKNVRLPGRMEIIEKGIPIILDGAHTPVSIKKLLETYKHLYPKGTIIFGSVQNKDLPAMADLLAPGADRIIISRPGNFKESDPEQIYKCFKKLHPHVELEVDPFKALEMALKEEKSNILVTGSFYMVAEIRKYLI